MIFEKGQKLFFSIWGWAFSVALFWRYFLSRWFFCRSSWVHPSLSPAHFSLTKNPKIQENSAFFSKGHPPPPPKNTSKPVLSDRSPKPLQTTRHLLCQHISLFLFHAGRPVASKRHAIQPGSKLLRRINPPNSTNPGCHRHHQDH